MLLLICNRELLFIGKRKDEDDMAKSTKTYEERIRALEKKEQESIEATKKLIAQRKELEKRKKAEESKKRTHRLCQIGGAVESVLGCPIEEEDLPPQSDSQEPIPPLLQSERACGFVFYFLPLSFSFPVPSAVL